MSEAPRYTDRPFSRQRRSFSRDQNDLVDLDTYLEFLPDDPEDVPIIINTANRDQWWYQHVYFQRLFYTQKGVSKLIKDRVLSQFCVAPYNQIGMRPEEEQRLHRAFEEHVLAPSPETQKKSLVDFGYIDILGAAAIGRRVALVPEATEHLLPGMGIPNGFVKLSPVEKADFFDGELHDALSALKSPLVTPQRVITGAIRRLTRVINDERLQEEAQARLRSDETYFPVRLRSLGFYYNLSVSLLKESQRSGADLDQGLRVVGISAGERQEEKAA